MTGASLSVSHLAALRSRISPRKAYTGHRTPHMWHGDRRARMDMMCAHPLSRSLPLWSQGHLHSTCTAPTDLYLIEYYYYSNQGTPTDLYLIEYYYSNQGTHKEHARAHFPCLHASSDSARAVTERRPPAHAHLGRLSWLVARHPSPSLAGAPP